MFPALIRMRNEHCKLKIYRVSGSLPSLFLFLRVWNIFCQRQGDRAEDTAQWYVQNPGISLSIILKKKV